MTEEDYDEAENFDVIPIRRLGPGLTEDDFELDFSGYSDILEIESNATVVRLEKEKELYVIFTDFELEMSIVIVQEDEKIVPKEYSEMPLSELKKLLTIALNPGNEDYDKAITLRDIIKDREEMREKHHKKR